MDAIIKAIGKTPSLATLPLRVEEGYLPALLTQSGGAMRALGAAMLRRETDRPIFVLCTDETNAGTLAADLEAMLGESVVQLTGRDLALRDIEVVSRQEEQRRLRALDALYAGALVAVCTVSGLLQRTLPPDILENAAFTLRLGEGEGPEALEPRLLACGYRRSDMVEGPGQFSRRGGILDIFSPGAERPVRAEFWGDEIDSMGFFDTDTQRRAENIESFRVLPACESLVDPSRAGSIAKELLSRAARAERREQTELARRLRRDAELISTGAPLPWSDRYLPELYSEYSTALDFIAPDAIVYIDAPNRCAEKAKDISDSLADDLKILREGAFPVAETGDYLLPWKDACGLRCRDGGRLQRGALSPLPPVGARYERPPASELRRQRGNGACRRAAVSRKRFPRCGVRLGRPPGGCARSDARAKRHTAAARLPERRSAAGGTGHRCGGRALRGS